MYLKKSHGRPPEGQNRPGRHRPKNRFRPPRKLKWVAFGSILLSFGAGFSISRYVQKNEADQQRATEARRTLFLGHLLTDLVQTQLDLIGSQGLELVRQMERLPNTIISQKMGQILHLAQLEPLTASGLASSSGVPANTPPFFRIQKSIRNMMWTASGATEDAYLQAVLSHLNPRELSQKGRSFLRIRQDIHGRGEWLSMALTSQVDSRNPILVLMDPADALSPFQRWATYPSKNDTRAYLIGSDGRVLAHSRKSLVSSSFHDLALFQSGILSVFSKPWSNGYGYYQGFDQMPVLASFFRIGDLPLATVVEEVILNQQPTFQYFSPALLSIAVILLVFWMTFFLLKSVLKPITMSGLDEMDLSLQHPAAVDSALDSTSQIARDFGGEGGRATPQDDVPYAEMTRRSVELPQVSSFLEADSLLVLESEVRWQTIGDTQNEGTRSS